MKVLHLLTSLRDVSGGPVATTFEFADRLTDRGITNEILGFGPINVPNSRVAPELVHSLVAREGAYCFSGALGRWLSQNLGKYDGVILHGMWQYPQLAVSRACLRAGIPYACFPHGMLDLWPVLGQGMATRLKKTLYWRIAERSIFAGAHAALFTTPREMARASTVFELPCPSMLVPYGIAVHNASAECEPFDFMELREKRIALFLGRVHPKKNVELLVRAWAAARPGKEWRLVIAGTGESRYLQRLLALVQEKGVADQVRFVGHVQSDRKQYLLAQAEWFLLPSFQENFGVAVLEALHHRCAVALSDEVYISDYFPEGCPILPLDIRTWTEFIRGPMQDAVYTKTVIAAQDARVLPRFRIDDVCDGWARVLQELFGERSGASREGRPDSLANHSSSRP